LEPLTATHTKLLEIRERKDLKLRPTKHLKTTFTGFDGVEKPLSVRYYQVQGILHLVLMKRFLLGDDTGLGKTLEAIAALCYIWEKDPDRKVIVLTTKSAAPQWVKEFGKFTTGVKVIACQGDKKQRTAARAMFEKATGPTVIVMGYRSAVQDFTSMQGWKDFILVADEATAFKTPTTQVHQVIRHFSGAAERTWGLTATLIKNHLMEGYGIYQVIVPGLFGMNKNQFMLYYCLCRMQSIPRSNRQIPVITGYLPERIQEFKAVIDPYYIGRAKHTVASDLPALIMQEIEVDLTDQQEEKYAEALAGLLEVGGSKVKDGDFTEVPEDSERQIQAGNALKEVTKLTAIIYCQQIINSPELIGIPGESPKLEALIDFLSEGAFEDEKVIVFSRFKKMIDIIMPRLAKEKIKAVRITGDESTAQRDAAMTSFQNPNSDVRVACLTTAGSEAINLQAAKAIVCFDTPWSAGEFLQLVGRMIRIGSTHDTCSVVHLVAKGKKKTVDHRVLEVLGKKMSLVEAVLGKRIKGTGESSIISVENDISDLFQSLKQDARERT